MENIFQLPTKRCRSGSVEMEIVPCKRMKIKGNPNLTYHCFHCQKKYSYSYSYSEIKQLYNHWLDEHHSRRSKPFLFYVNSLVGCRFCDEIGFFSDIVIHQYLKHSNHPIVVVDPVMASKCAICDFCGDEMIKHFQDAHQLITQMNVLNPACLSDKELKKLRSMDIHQKFLCKRCDKVYESKEQIKRHHSSKHLHKKRRFEKFFDESKHLICGFCGADVRPSKFLDHIETECKQFECNECGYDAQKLSKLIKHTEHVHTKTSAEDFHLKFINGLKEKFFRTKCVFGNGLVVNKHNLLLTNFNDYDKFLKLIVNSMAEPNVQSRSQCQEANGIQFCRSGGNDEVVKQARLINNVQIRGIPMVKNENLDSIIQKLLEALDVLDLTNNIMTFYRGTGDATNLIIIKFQDYSHKKRILEAIRYNHLKSSALIKLPPGHKDEFIEISYHLTPLYQRMWRMARDAKSLGIITGFFVVRDGFGIRLNGMRPLEIVQDEQRLRELINNCKK